MRKRVRTVLLCLTLSLCLTVSALAAPEGGGPPAGESPAAVLESVQPAPEPESSVPEPVPPAESPAPEPESPAVAYASAQIVSVDGAAVAFQMYALKDAQGNDTNYVRIRDVAKVLNGTAAQFSVNWWGMVDLRAGESYVSNGSEGETPFSGDRSFTRPALGTMVNGEVTALDAILLRDDDGNGYTYYKLRDLGRVLGFNVGWSAIRGVYVETAMPYRE